jgi:hypothetical protein
MNAILLHQIHGNLSVRGILAFLLFLCFSWVVASGRALVNHIKMLIYSSRFHHKEHKAGTLFMANICAGMSV